MNKNTLFLLLAAGGAYYVWAAAEKKKRDKQLGSAPESEQDEPLALTEAASSAAGASVATAFDMQSLSAPQGDEDYESLWIDNIQDPWA